MKELSLKETCLEISGVGFPKWSARGVKQTLEPIGGVEPKRTINGELLGIDSPCAGKYRTVLSGTDKNMPAFAHLRKGMQVQVHSIIKWWEPLNGGVCTLARPPASGSIAVVDQQLTPVVYPKTIEGVVVTATSPSKTKDKAIWVLYRPVFAMRVMGWGMQTDERGLESQWSLVLEEV